MIDLTGVVAQAIEQWGAQRARLGRRAWPRVWRHEPFAVLDLDRVERSGGDEALLAVGGDPHLAAGQEARAHADARGAQREGGGEAAPVGDPAGSDDRDLAGDVDDLRDEHHRGHQATVTAGLPALGDKHVRSGPDRLLGLVDVHHLLDPQDAGVVGARDQVDGHGEVKRDRGGPEGERGGERLLVQRAHRVVDRERTLGQIAQPSPLSTQRRERTRGRAEAAQPARLAHRGGQVDLVPRPERGQ